MIYGGVAHLGERLNGIQEVVGSIPIISTKCFKDRLSKRSFVFSHMIFKIYNYKLMQRYCPLFEI